jgi:hypothetical protein
MNMFGANLGLASLDIKINWNFGSKIIVSPWKGIKYWESFGLKKNILSIIGSKYPGIESLIPSQRTIYPD